MDFLDKDYKIEQVTPSELAVYFLSNFFEGTGEEIEEMPIAQALTKLIHNLVYETVSIMNDEEEHTVH